MSHGGNMLLALLLNPVSHYHERRRIVRLEVFPRRLGKHGWAKRAERLAILNPAVQNIFHLLAAWIRKDAAIAERSGPELHPSLKPTDNVAGRDGVRSPVD